MPESRRAVVALCGAVSAVAATFAAILAPQPGPALSHSPLFFVCVFVAVVFLVILLAAGYPDFRDWLRPARASRRSAGAVVPEVVTQTADRPAMATSLLQPTATATAKTRAPHGEAISRKTAQAYKKMSADVKYSLYERMEFAEKAGVLSPEIGAEAYKSIASNEYVAPTSGMFQPAHRQKAAEKAGVLSPRIGAEAYQAIANDRRVPVSERRRAAERAYDLSPEIGAEAFNVIARKPSHR
jgi:hypothetical protein